MARGGRSGIALRRRRVCYSGNGLRSVPLNKTLAGIENYFLTGGAEAQFEMIHGAADGCLRAVLEYLPPPGEPENQRYFGKGVTAGQTLASACMEFIERQSAKMKPGDGLLEASYPEVASDARDPVLFSIAKEAGYEPAKRIDWIWGYSLTRSEPALVPANLVFFPYETDPGEKYITWTDSNGLASGNNLEEAVLHGILEVIERDAVVIAEYNRLPFAGIKADGLSSEAVPGLDRLEAAGYSCSFRAVPTDISINAVAVFLRHEDDSANCCVAFGCHLDPGLAMARALTEAIQLLPPTVNHGGWLLSGSPERYAARPSREIPFDGLRSSASADLKDNIVACVAILNDIGSEVIIVDLSLPDIPFSAVRVLATGLQPLLHEGDMRLSPRFFDVPVKLGFRDRPRDPAEVKIWPLCGYR